jgi:ribose/xylose/arabinose/galactoside ABC-type transport system permease subunit
MGRSVRRRLAFLLAGNLTLLVVIFALLKEGSSTGAVLARIGPDIAPVALAAFALTGILFTGAIDLSIGSIIALSGTLFACVASRGWSPTASFAVCAAAGWFLMSLNGLLVTGLKMPAIIVTLAGLPLYRGLALIIADSFVPNFSGNISVQLDSYHAPAKYYAGSILLAAIAIATLAEVFSKHPRLWLSLGNSPDACNLMGLRPQRILRSAFTLGGISLAGAVVLYATRVQAIEPARMALGVELQVVAAVILGGTNIFGGEGSYLGTLLGVLFLYLISQVLIYAGANAYLQDALTGGIILLIIGVDCALHRSAKRMEELR